MATGKLAFPGKTSALVFKSIFDQSPPPPTQLEPSLPQQLDQIVDKALEKDRDLRYQHAADFRTDLNRLKRDTPSGWQSVKDSPAHAESGATDAGGRNASRKWWLAASSIGLLALALAAGYWLSVHYALPRLNLYYLVGGVLALWSIGQLAAWQPAWRAAAVPPSVATRTV